MLETGTAVKRLHNYILYSNYKGNGPCFYYYYYELALPLIKRVRKEITVVKKESNAYVCGVLRSTSHVQEHQLTWKQLKEDAIPFSEPTPYAQI